MNVLHLSGHASPSMPVLSNHCIHNFFTGKSRLLTENSLYLCFPQTIYIAITNYLQVAKLCVGL